jgi:uncharacterized protein YndB with AHSA1/START domain
VKVDVVRYLGAVAREVSSREHEGRPVRAVVARRIYDTSIEDLWDAITSTERIPRWFLPVSGELRLGGRYQFQGNAGGQITRCQPPRHLAVTWEFGGSMSWVTVNLIEDRGGGTCLELEHVVPVGEFWDQFGPGAVGVGWDLTFMGLALHLASGASVDREEAATWSASEEGKEFARGSSNDWCRASIGGGTEEAAARAAAERTTAAYTGEGTRSPKES